MNDEFRIGKVYIRNDLSVWWAPEVSQGNKYVCAELRTSVDVDTGESKWVARLVQPDGSSIHVLLTGAWLFDEL